MRVRPYGDVGVLVEVSSGADALRLCAAVEASSLAAAARPGWNCVLVTSDLSVAQLTDAVHRLDLHDVDPPTPRRITVPVTYDGADLDDVARLTRLTSDEVVRRHSGGRYVVRCLGFSRGFPYLEGLHPSLWVPRRDDPRTRVPAGAVAIAGEQTGIYTQSSPGGWQLLGSTTFTVFDEHADPPSQLRPGDVVTFQRVG